MAIHVWLEEGVTDEQEISGAPGQVPYELNYWPYKMFSLDILNHPESQGNVQIMINDQSLPSACTLEPGRGRQWDAKNPRYWRVTINFLAVATVRVTATR